MISIVVSWRDRRELSQALPNLVDAAHQVGGDVTIVNFSGSGALLRSQTGPYAGKVKTVTVAGQRYFNKSAAQNVGAAQSKRPWLFFCDCDVVCQPQEIAGVVAELATTPGTFATFAGVHETESNSSKAKH